MEERERGEGMWGRERKEHKEEGERGEKAGREMGIKWGERERGRGWVGGGEREE